MNKQNRHDGSCSHKVANSTQPAIGANCGTYGGPKNAVAANRKKQGYAPVQNAVTGKKKF